MSCIREYIEEMTSTDKQGHGIIYNARVEDIGGEDILEMLSEPYTRIDSGDDFKG